MVPVCVTRVKDIRVRPVCFKGYMPTGETLWQIRNRVMDALESGEDSMGFCVECGAEAYGVEPDARKYECESCGARAVYGAEELLLMMA